MLQQPHPSLCQPPAPGSSLQLKAWMLPREGPLVRRAGFGAPPSAGSCPLRPCNPSLPRHLDEKSPGQVPGTTYTAQCNGVKGFPSRYANGLCSSNNSRQSSCPVRREGHKHTSAQPAMEQEGTKGLSSSPHDQREAPGSWGETAQTRSLNRGLKS